MSKARNLVAKARKNGVSEGKSEALAEVALRGAPPKPTIIHVEPQVDTKAVADQIQALMAFLPALEALAGKDTDLKGVQSAIEGVTFDPVKIAKAISGLTEAVASGETYGEQIGELLGLLKASEDRQAALLEKVEDNTKAILEMVDAFKAKRTLKFTDGGAVLEAT